MRKLITFCLFLMLSRSGFASELTREFDLKTLDGLSHITGQIDYPTHCHKEKYPAVFLVAGTGLYYRNLYLGTTGSERDYVFTDLSQKFTKQCVAVVRYDYRGVSCDLSSRDNIKKCLNQRIRTTVDDRTIIDDIQVVYDHVLEQSDIDKNSLGFLALSEGSINISRLVARKSINAKTLLFIGGVTESPKSLIRWQFIDRSVDQAFAMDTNGDGILTNFEVMQGYPGSFFQENDIPMANLISPSGIWNRFALKSFFTLEFNAVVGATMITYDDIPYLQKGIVYSRMRWWKKWFMDATPVLENLKAFEGPISYFNGTIDILAPAERQLDFLKHYGMRMKRAPEFNLIPGKGHVLSNHPLYGPIDEDLADRVTAKMVKNLK